MEKPVSAQTLQRLPVYLSCLKTEPILSEQYVSAKMLSDALGLGEIQVRKDLASVSSGGKPKVGYITTELARDIELFLGYGKTKKAVLIGFGKLGSALMSYSGFREYGLDIAAAFDCNPAKHVTGTKPVYPMEQLNEIIEKLNAVIGIITVPASEAQNACNLLIAANIKAIWNFAPVNLAAPKGILIKTENMAASLAVMSQHLSKSEK